MSDHIQDEEQVEALKRWWQENGQSTIVAVVLAVGGTFGWQYFQDYSEGQREVASELWFQAETQMQSADPAIVRDGKNQAEQLKSSFADSTYAVYAALKLAALAVENDELETAETELRWALAASDAQSALGQLIQLRLARVMAARGDEAGALRILEAGSSDHTAAYALALGDIHLAAGRDQQALDAYLEARAASLSMGSPPGLLEDKITSLESRLASQEGAS